MITPGGRVGDASPLGKKNGERGLTDYVRMVAHALLRKHPEWTESHAIAVARNAQKKWLAKSKNPAVKAASAESLAEQSVLDHRKRGHKLSNETDENVDLAIVRTQEGANRYGVPIGSQIGSGQKQQSDTLLTPETVNQIRAYQKAHGLPVTGTLDPATVGYVNRLQAQNDAKKSGGSGGSGSAKSAASAADKDRKAKEAAARKAAADARRDAADKARQQRDKERTERERVRIMEREAAAKERIAKAQERARRSGVSYIGKNSSAADVKRAIAKKGAVVKGKVSLAHEVVRIVGEEYPDDIELGRDGSKWRHGWIPLNPVAVAMKAKKWNGPGNSGKSRGDIAKPNTKGGRAKAVIRKPAGTFPKGSEVTVKHQGRNYVGTVVEVRDAGKGHEQTTVHVPGVGEIRRTPDNLSKPRAKRGSQSVAGVKMNDREAKEAAVITARDVARIRTSTERSPKVERITSPFQSLVDSGKVKPQADRISPNEQTRRANEALHAADAKARAKREIIHTGGLSAKEARQKINASLTSKSYTDAEMLKNIAPKVGQRVTLSDGKSATITRLGKVNGVHAAGVKLDDGSTRRVTVESLTRQSRPDSIQNPFTGKTRMEELRETAKDLKARGASKSAARHRREIRASAAKAAAEKAREQLESTPVGRAQAGKATTADFRHMTDSQKIASGVMMYGSDRSNWSGASLKKAAQWGDADAQNELKRRAAKKAAVDQDRTMLQKAGAKKRIPSSPASSLSTMSDGQVQRLYQAGPNPNKPAEYRAIVAELRKRGLSGSGGRGRVR